MHRLSLHYSLQNLHNESAVQNPLIDLLRAVDSSGSISAAARKLELSYRHVWGELRRWEVLLGQELLTWEKGQAARLSEFGSKLMWAERQAQARLAPQIEALRSELERSFALAFDPDIHVLTLYASHDEGLGVLREHAAQHDPVSVHLDIRYMGSLDCIRALNEGRCTLACFHALSETSQDGESQKAYRRMLRLGNHKIIGFMQREVGLMVAPGNPLLLESLANCAQSNVRFSLRPSGSGTLITLSELLQKKGLSLGELHPAGLDQPTNIACAQAVASGSADVALGSASTAVLAGLDFVPLAKESVYLVCLKSELDQPAMKALRSILSEESWKNRVRNLRGHMPHRSGEVLSLKRVLPWWSLIEKHQPASHIT